MGGRGCAQWRGACWRPGTSPARACRIGGRQFEVGELVQAADYVRVRRSPGYVNKPDEDTLGAFAPAATLNIVGGPQDAGRVDLVACGRHFRDGRRIDRLGCRVCAQWRDADAAIRPNWPAPTFPIAATGTYLGAPFRQRFGISQLWGENPQVYGQFSYDGVPLRGHNGIDFLTPTGTDLLAVEDGVVSEVVYQ